MTHRVLPLFVAVLALVVWMSGPALAQKDNTHEGKVVRALDGKLTMTDKDGKNEHTHAVADNATITIDGKPGKLADLQKDYTVKVTTEKRGDKTLATKIEARKSAK